MSCWKDIRNIIAQYLVFYLQYFPNIYIWYLLLFNFGQVIFLYCVYFTNYQKIIEHKIWNIFSLSFVMQTQISSWADHFVLYSMIKKVDTKFNNKKLFSFSFVIQTQLLCWAVHFVFDGCLITTFVAKMNYEFNSFPRHVKAIFRQIQSFRATLSKLSDLFIKQVEN